MSRFVVSFMKDVLGDNGRQAEICQRILEIDAPTEGEAKEIAKQHAPLLAPGLMNPFRSRFRSSFNPSCRQTRSRGRGIRSSML